MMINTNTVLGRSTASCIIAYYILYYIVTLATHVYYDVSCYCNCFIFEITCKEAESYCH